MPTRPPSYRPPGSLTKAEADKLRPSARQRGYDSRWQAARTDYLKAHPTCAECSAPATVVDHVAPHRGDQRLFWDRSNWQPLCASHHSAKTVRTDGGWGRPTRRGGGGGSKV